MIKNQRNILDFFPKEKSNLRNYESDKMIFENNDDNINNNNLSLEEDIKELNKENSIENNKNENDYYLKNKKRKENEIIEFNNQNNSTPPFIFSLIVNPINTQKKLLVLIDLRDKKNIKLKKVLISQNNFENRKDNNLLIPYQNCRIINVNGIAYLIGGKTGICDIFGSKECYKISYNQSSNEIKINKITPTKYEHYSHSLLYISKYNIIIVCSGYNQRNCEYLQIKNDEKNIEANNENQWETFCPLRNPRENAISFLFNQQYIFLIGGIQRTDNIDNKEYENYDVFDFDSYIKFNFQTYWNTYSLKNQDRLIFHQKEYGIIYFNNDIFILGGNNSDKIKLMWKIEFMEKKKDERLSFLRANNNKDYMIKSLNSWNKINNYFSKDSGISYFGNQDFSEFFNDYFINITLGGKLELIPKNFLIDSE